MEPWVMVVIPLLVCTAVLSPWLFRTSGQATLRSSVGGRETVRSVGAGPVKVIVGAVIGLLLAAAAVVTLFGLGVLSLPTEGRMLAVMILGLVELVAVVALVMCLVAWSRNRARGESRWERVHCRVTEPGPPFRSRESNNLLYPYRISYPVNGVWRTIEYATSDPIPDIAQHYRWLDLTRPEKTPVEGGAQPPQRGWWPRNMLWFIPLVAVLALLIPIAILLAV